MGTAARPSGTDSMKQRVNRCLLKLSDRDTEAMAAAELDSIARALAADELPAFLAAVSDARPTDKTPLRRHCLQVLALLAVSHPPDAVAPLVPRLLSAALRRVRDPDSSVRAALVDAARAAAASAASAPVALRPLTDALLHEQDQCAQLAAALATTAAVEASAPTADLAAYLHRLLPRLLKLLRSSVFKAKPALITLIGTAAAASGATAAVPSLRDALASADWAARKAAAEALAALALEHKGPLATYKSSCIESFESRRFDKVKIVRESMNRMIEAWKEIPNVEEDEPSSDAPAASQSQAISFRADSATFGRNPAASAGSNSVPSVTRRNRSPISKSNSTNVSSNVTNRTNPSSVRNKKLSPPSHHNVYHPKNCDYKADIAVALDATPIKMVTEEKLLKEGNARARLEARRMLFQKNSDERGNKLAGLKSGSRVVPYEGGGNLEEITEVEPQRGEFKSAHKDEDLSKIKMQLVQIESQQTSLLDLLQKFIGSSQNGMNCLETRVHGLEMALDEISRDLAVSSGRMSNSDPDGITCCILRPKFWRRHDGGRYSSRFSVSDVPNHSEGSRSSYQWDRQKFGLRGGIVTNPLADLNTSSVGSTVVAQEGRRQDMALHKSRMG